MTQGHSCFVTQESPSHQVAASHLQFSSETSGIPSQTLHLDGNTLVVVVTGISISVIAEITNQIE